MRTSDSHDTWALRRDLILKLMGDEGSFDVVQHYLLSGRTVYAHSEHEPPKHLIKSRGKHDG